MDPAVIGQGRGCRGTTSSRAAVMVATPARGFHHQVGASPRMSLGSKIHTVPRFARTSRVAVDEVAFVGGRDHRARRIDHFGNALAAGLAHPRSGDDNLDLLPARPDRHVAGDGVAVQRPVGFRPPVRPGASRAARAAASRGVSPASPASSAAGPRAARCYPPRPASPPPGRDPQPGHQQPSRGHQLESLTRASFSCWSQRMPSIRPPRRCFDCAPTATSLPAGPASVVRRPVFGLTTAGCDPTTDCC